MHLQSQWHKNILAGHAHQSWFCHICQCPIESSVWDQYKEGKRHWRQANSRQIDIYIEPDIVLPPETHTFCNLCQTSIFTQFWQSHLWSCNHLTREKYTAFKTVMDEAEKEKNGVTIKGDLDFGILEPAISANGKAVSLKILSTVPLAKIVLVSVKLSSELGSQQRRAVSPWV